jgi:hypothetical protein
LLACLSAAPADTARPGLPEVEGVAWKDLREHTRRLLEALEKEGQPLPARTGRAVRSLLAKEPADPDMAAGEVQRLLDAHCLLGVDINPESRVKAVRGPASARLRQGEPAVFLVKFHNEGGVRHAPRVGGPGVVGDAAGGWLEASFITPAALDRDLSGRRLEYRLLRLVAREAGRREATLRIDVGQGTQDLGFRAEVPVLFAVGRKAGSGAP